MARTYVLEGRVDARTFASLLSAYQAMGTQINSRAGFQNDILEDVLRVLSASDLEFDHFTETEDALEFIESVLGPQGRAKRVDHFLKEQLIREQESPPPQAIPLFDQSREYSREVQAEAREMLDHIEGGGNAQESIHDSEQ
jgi:hypothetical protein